MCLVSASQCDQQPCCHEEGNIAVIRPVFTVSLLVDMQLKQGTFSGVMAATSIQIWLKLIRCHKMDAV